MERGSIQRTIDVAARPEVAFAVLSDPRHVEQWWPDEASFEPIPGAEGELRWINPETGESTVVEMTVVETDPPRRFSFRWAYRDSPRSGPSLLVTFELEPIASGTRIQMTETGFREMGWEVAQLEEQYLSHIRGWDRYIPSLADYLYRLEMVE